MTLLGTSVGRIRIVDTLGEGRMGEVYVGYDEILKRKVALKAIRGERRLDAEAKARFLREARILSRLDHPGICRIHEFIEGDGSDFLVLELIAGKNLREALEEHELDPSFKLHVAERVTEALVAAHAQGIAHRDLKPENVMLTSDGGVKVLDFGLAYTVDEQLVTALGGGSGSGDGGEPGDGEPVNVEDPLGAGAARAGGDATARPAAGRDSSAGQTVTDTVALSRAPWDGRPAAAPSAAEPSPARPSDFVETRLGLVMGTVAYMSPEQARGERATTAGDMYSLGLLLQELFTGRPSYEPGLALPQLLVKAGAGETLPVTGIEPDLAALIGRLKSFAP